MKDFEEWFAEVHRLAKAAGVNDYQVNHAYVWLDDYDAGKTPTEALHIQYPTTSPDYSPDLYTKHLPPNSRWEHTNGGIYTVLFLTNSYSTDYHRYPPTVVYQGQNGKLWSRLAADWDRSMTRIPTTWWERFFLGR